MIIKVLKSLPDTQKRRYWSFRGAVRFIGIVPPTISKSISTKKNLISSNTTPMLGVFAAWFALETRKGFEHSPLNFEESIRFMQTLFHAYQDESCSNWSIQKKQLIERGATAKDENGFDWRTFERAVAACCGTEPVNEFAVFLKHLKNANALKIKVMLKNTHLLVISICRFSY